MRCAMNQAVLYGRFSMRWNWWALMPFFDAAIRCVASTHLCPHPQDAARHSSDGRPVLRLGHCSYTLPPLPDTGPPLGRTRACRSRPRARRRRNRPAAACRDGIVLRSVATTPTARSTAGARPTRSAITGPGPPAIDDGRGTTEHERRVTSRTNEPEPTAADPGERTREPEAAAAAGRKPATARDGIRTNEPGGPAAVTGTGTSEPERRRCRRGRPQTPPCILRTAM